MLYTTYKRFISCVRRIDNSQWVSTGVSDVDLDTEIGRRILNPLLDDCLDVDLVPFIEVYRVILDCLAIDNLSLLPVSALELVNEEHSLLVAVLSVWIATQEDAK